MAKILGNVIYERLRENDVELSPNIETIIPQFETILDRDFLLDLGFCIVSEDNDTITVRIPNGWNHIEIDDDKQVLIDSKNRVRVQISSKEKRSYLKTRFSSRVFINEETMMLLMQIIDTNKVISEYVIPVKRLEKYCKVFKGWDGIKELLNSIMIKILDDTIPNWYDNKYYWDIELDIEDKINILLSDSAVKFID